MTDSYEYTDEYGDSLIAQVLALPSTAGPRLYIETDPAGVVIPLDGIDAYVSAMQKLATDAHQRAQQAARDAHPAPDPAGPHTPAQTPANPKD